MYLLKFVPYYILGVGISAIFVFPGIFYIINSPRISSGKLYLTSPFKVNDLLSYITVFLKSFSYSIMGGTSTTGSSKVILEDQILYCGIFTMLVFPQIFGFKNSSKREKNVIYIILGLIAIYYVFPYARYFLNAFSMEYYKTSSFWSIVFLLISGVYVFNSIENGNECFNLYVLTLTVVLYLFIFCVIFITKEELIQKKELLIVLLIIAAFSIAIFKVHDFNYKKALILVLCAFEISIGIKNELSYMSLNVTKKNAETTYYNDKLKICIDLVKEQDNDVYRIITDDTMLNNTQRYNYMGIGEYVSTPSEQLVNFYNLFDVNRKNIKMLEEFNNRIMLNTMVGVKYFIKTKNNSEVPEGFEYEFSSPEGYEVYKNILNLPIGYMYNQYTDYDKFKNYNNSFKDFSALSSAVLDKKDIENIHNRGYNIKEKNFDMSVHEYNLVYIDSSHMNVLNNALPDNFSYYSLDNDPQIIFKIDNNTKVAQEYTLTMNVQSDVATGGQIYYSNEGENFSGEKMIVFDVDKGSEDYTFTFESDKPIVNLRIDAGDIEGNYTLKNIELKSVKSISFEDYTLAVNSLKENYFDVEYFSQNKITGKINSAENGILFFSIPNDYGWTVKIDGEKTDKLTVNGGFIGVPVNAGVHSVELNYMVPLLPMGIVVSITSTIICIFIFMRRKQNLIKN